MRPDKHKKKDFLKSDCDYDSKLVKHVKIHQIKDEDEIDELPSKGKKYLVYRRNYFSNAVDRFLRSRIGDKWDAVYSDLIKRVGHEDNTRWCVDLNAYEEDGKIVSVGYCGLQEVRGFYVLNGILGEKQRPSYKRKNTKVHVTFVDGFVIFKHNNLFFKAPTDKSVGDWWELDGKYAPFKRSDSYLKYSTSEKRNSEKKFIDARFIRQLNHKEIKNWELPNTDINE